MVKLYIYPASHKAPGVNPWRNVRIFPKGHNLDATAVNPALPKVGVNPWGRVHHLT
jgi:hypothetical protein